MTEFQRQAPAATIAHVLMALVAVGLFLFPFIAKIGYGNAPWYQALLGDNRVFLFWIVGYGLLIGGGFWADRNADKIPAWMNKPLK